MNIPWVCASCRRQLLHNYQQQIRRQQRATYISLGQGNTASSQVAQDAKTRERSKRYTGPRRIDPAEAQRKRNIPTLELLQSAEDEFMERLLANANYGRNDTGGLYSRKILKEQVAQPPAATEPPKFRNVEPTPPSARVLRPLTSNVVSLNGLRDYKLAREETGSISAGKDDQIEPGTLIPMVGDSTTATISPSSAAQDTLARKQPGARAIELRAPPSPGRVSSSRPRWGQYAEGKQARTQDSSQASVTKPQSPVGLETTDLRTRETHRSGIAIKTTAKKPTVSSPWYQYLKTEHGISESDDTEANLQRIFAKWDTNTGTSSRPPLSSVIQTFLEQNPQQRLSTFSWLTSLRLLLKVISGCIVTENPQAHNLLEKYKLELFNIWNLSLNAQAGLIKVDTDDAKALPPTSWRLLSKAVATSDILATEHKLHRRLLRFFSSKFRWQHMDLIAVATLAFLQHDHTRFSSSLHYSPEIEEFCKFITLLAKHSEINKGWNASREIYVKQRKIDERAVDIIKPVFMELTSVPSDNQLPIEQNESATRTVTARKSTETQLDRRIGRAIEARDPGQVAALWDKLCMSRTDQSSPSILPALSTQFLTAFMAVRMPNRALEVWNTMANDGVIPDIRAWDAMLKGCGLARDAQGVDDIWTRFLQSGIKPDAQIWATRIHALTTSGHWESGIAAFQEMASNWISAVKKGHQKEVLPDLKTMGDYHDTPKPSTFVLNGLVTGLARGKKYEHLEKIFSWAQRLGITMDAHSFNPILAAAVRRGDGATGMEILDQMKSVGATPDIATYTLLLQLLFRSEQASNSVASASVSASPSTPASSTSTELASNRSQAAANILQMMQSSNIAANPYTYATLISGVLHNPHSSPSNNLSAAYAVLIYMESQSIPMSSQVYTNFLSHHFSQLPPDLAAIEALWSRARQDRLVFLDNFFFDRLIEGFAKCGEVGKMMAALGHASKRGKVPSWRAMTEVIKALVNDGDLMRAEEIVANVKKEDMEKDQRRSKTGRETFWQSVQELGLKVSLQDDLYDSTLLDSLSARAV